ncbi:MAG: S-layer homology domain-containing protein [Clostridia bacterium]|nr:S-layer homology domain-containing protein [Clostridia bacterium]
MLRKTAVVLLLAVLVLALVPTGMALAVDVTLSLSRTEASVGDSVTASGEADANTWVAIKVVDAEGDIVFFDAVKSGPDGSYICTFKVPSVQPGALTCVAGYGNNVATASLTVTAGGTTPEPEPEEKEITEPSVTVTEQGKKLRITRNTPSTTITVPANVTGATVSVKDLLEASGTGRQTSPLPQVTIDSPAAEVAIPAGARVSGPAGWDGTINLPTVEPSSSVSIPPQTGKRITVEKVVEIGFGNVPLTFDRAVRILFPGEAGKGVGYFRGGTFYRITRVLSADTQEAGDALPAGGDGKIDVDDDLVVWTKHFTKFVTFTETSVGDGSGTGGTGDTGDGEATIVRPYVSSTDPADKAANVPVDKEIKVVFTEKVSAGAGFTAITLKDAAGKAVEFTARIEGNALFLKPKAVLDYGTAYTVSLPANAVKDSDGYGMSAAYTFTFTTAAQEQPQPTQPAAPAPTKTFADIQGHWAQKDIELMAGLGIAGGVAPDRFDPNGLVTRAQFAAFLVRSLGLAEVKPATASFTDVGPGAWYYGAVETARAAGLVGGYPDRTFKPDQRISREEIAAMVVRALAKAGKPVEVADPEAVLSRFADQAAIGAWAREAAAQAVEAGIVGGREGNRFAPKENATRAEAVVMLKRMLVSLGRIGE